MTVTSGKIDHRGTVIGTVELIGVNGKLTTLLQGWDPPYH